MQVKRGITRLVFLTKTKAIKIPNPTYSLQHFLKGWLANITEKDIWKAFNSEGMEAQDIKQLICPVLTTYLKCFVVVMPRCQPVPPQDFTPHKRLESVCGDAKADNYGLLNNRLVCLDYGQ